MVLNFSKTKEIVLRRPNPKLILHPSSPSHIEQVMSLSYWVLFSLKDFTLMAIFSLS